MSGLNSDAVGLTNGSSIVPDMAEQFGSSAAQPPKYLDNGQPNPEIIIPEAVVPDTPEIGAQSSQAEGLNGKSFAEMGVVGTPDAGQIDDTPRAPKYACVDPENLVDGGVRTGPGNIVDPRGAMGKGQEGQQKRPIPGMRL